MNQTLSGIKEAWHNNKRPVLVVVAFISMLVLIGCGFFWLHFPSLGLSKNQIDWYNFSVYITAVISFLNLLVFAILSYLIYRHNSRSTNNQVYERVLHEKPLIIFSFKISDGCYSIQNIGKGAAINVVVKSNFKDTKWLYGYIWNSLSAKNDPEKLDWTTNTNAICASYWDSFENRYVSFMDNNRLRVINVGNKDSDEKYKLEFSKSELPADIETWRK